ncbi:hypothetical protein SALBM217S_07849 [Streptomyces griseoloalbus]
MAGPVQRFGRHPAHGGELGPGHALLQEVPQQRSRDEGVRVLRHQPGQAQDVRRLGPPLFVDLGQMGHQLPVRGITEHRQRVGDAPDMVRLRAQEDGQALAGPLRPEPGRRRRSRLPTAASAW